MRDDDPRRWKARGAIEEDDDDDNEVDDDDTIEDKAVDVVILPKLPSE